MARTRSDSGLSSGRLGVTSRSLLVSQGGQLATSTPLKSSGVGLRPTPGLKSGPTPPGLEAALQESARVRRRLADELAREAAADYDGGAGDSADRWPVGRPPPQPPDLSGSMLSAVDPATPPSGSSDAMQSCGDVTDSDDSGALRQTARRRQSSDGGISGISTISSRSMPEWTAPQRQRGYKNADAGVGDYGRAIGRSGKERRMERNGRREDEGRGREDRERGKEDRERRREDIERRRGNGECKRTDKAHREAELSGTDHGAAIDSTPHHPAGFGGTPGAGGRTGKGARRSGLRRTAGGRRRLEVTGMGSVPARRQRAGERQHPPREASQKGTRQLRAGRQEEDTAQGASQEGLRYEERHHQGIHQQETRYRLEDTEYHDGLQDTQDRRDYDQKEPTYPSTPYHSNPTNLETPYHSNPTLRTPIPSGLDTPLFNPTDGVTVPGRTPGMTGSVRYLLEHTPAVTSTRGRSLAAGRSQEEAEPQAEDAEAGGPERRQLLDAVSGALSCQLAGEADRLRQLHGRQLQRLRAQLQRQRRLETEALQNQLAAVERTLQQTVSDHARQLASRDSQLTTLREELAHTRQQHDLERQKMVSEWQRSSERERTAQQRLHSRQLQTLSRAAAARLADLARQHQLATQQLLATGKSLELQLARREDELDEERGRREELERRLQRLESTPATDRHKTQLSKQRRNVQPALGIISTATASVGLSTTSAITSAAEPATGPAVEPATDPAVEPATEPASEHASEPAIEPATEHATEHASGPAAEPAVEPASEPFNLGPPTSNSPATPLTLGDLTRTDPTPAGPPPSTAELRRRLSAAESLASRLEAQLRDRAGLETAGMERQRRREQHALQTQSEEAAQRTQMALQSSGAEEKVALLQSQMALISLEASGKARLAELSSPLLPGQRAAPRPQLQTAEDASTRQVERISQELGDQSEDDKMDSSASGGGPDGRSGDPAKIPAAAR